jgi:nicotinamide phosphoribosyltransferase
MLNPILYIDGYKADHRNQYPKGTNRIVSNFTPRSSRLPGVDAVIFFGTQYFIKEVLLNQFNQGFFKVPKEDVVSYYRRRMDGYIGPGAIDVEHIAELHELGYLPIRIKALPEGALVPMQVPCLVIENTLAKFSWLVNYLETVLSNSLWGPTTSATTAFQYRRAFNVFARATGAPLEFCQWQGHDFSMRGMWGVEAAAMSGAGHLLSFTGTDTLPAIDFLEKYYSASGLVGGSVAATEHSVMCAGGKESEEETYKRLITEVYPKGIVSIVSDTWDFWGIVTHTLPALKSIIMARDGKLVIRPDSGDPVKIIVGDPDAVAGSPEHKGLIQCLWETFGGTLTAKGYKTLDSHIGAIYGDSITLDRQSRILVGLYEKGFASSNVVLGIGSFTYTYVTRDSFGFAMKATYAEVNGVGRELFKQPKTDSGKNSHRGLIKVVKEGGAYKAIYPVTPAEFEEGELEVIFEDGKLIRETDLNEIRRRVEAQL